MTTIALMKHQQDLARAAIDSAVARALPREPLRLRAARRLRDLAVRLEGSGRPQGARPTFIR